MLRGRRLLLSQPPLSGWRTTASTTTTTTTTTAVARGASYSTSRIPDGLGSDHSAPTQEAQSPQQKEELVKDENVQDLQNPSNASSETEVKDLRAPRALAFRKYAIDGTVPLDALYVYAKLPNRYRKVASSGEQALDQQLGENGRHFQESGTSGTTQADLPQLPVVKGDSGNKWTEVWVKKIGKRLGLRISMRDTVYFKLPIARRMGLKISDPRLASPAMALAALEHRENLAKRVNMAKERQKKLASEGTKPLYPTRDIESKGDPNFESNQIRRESEVVGKASGLSARKENNLKAAQPTPSDLVGADLRDSLRDAEATSARPDAGKSTNFGEMKDRREPFYERLGLLPGRFEPAPLVYTGDRVPTGIRFTVRPTWLPFVHETTQAGKNIKEEEKLEASPQGATEAITLAQAGSGDQQSPQSATDNTKEKTAQSAPVVADAPSLIPENRPLSPEHIRQSSPIQNLQPKETFQNIFGMLFPEETGPVLRPSQARAEVGQKAKPVVKRRSTPKVPGGGIYKKLFPDEFPDTVEPQPQSQPQAEETEKQSASPNEEDLVPPEESIFISLRNEVRNWIPEEQRKDITAPEPGEQGSHSTVMILSGLSNSLIDTDFYRILPESKHIEGWAGGLVKVVQARDALSYEPLGRYFLMFHSHPAADAYKAEIIRLHSLSKRLLHSSMGKGPLADAPTNPQAFLTDEEKAAVRSFTLCPPTAPLQINVHIWNSNLIREIAQQTNIADVVQALRPDVATPSKVLVTVNTIPGSKAGAGGGLTTDELWLTLRDDGRERGAPWVLSNLKEGIMPVRLTSTSRHGKIDFRSEAVPAPLDGPIYDELDMLAEPPGTSKTEPFAARKVTYDAWQDRSAKKDDFLDKMLFLAPESTASAAAKAKREEKFNRFVVTFTQPAISRRFVRSWHKRAIWDAYEQRSVSIDAVALMQ